MLDEALARDRPAAGGVEESKRVRRLLYLGVVGVVVPGAGGAPPTAGARANASIARCVSRLMSCSLSLVRALGWIQSHPSPVPSGNDAAAAFN